MLLKLKDKDTLVVDHFLFKCCVGKNGIKKKRKEGDKITPKGIYSLGKLYYRSDRVKKPLTKLSTKKITKDMGWCDDPDNILYNKEIKINNKVKCEKLFRKDNSYDYLIVISYNTKNIVPGKGSAIFIHLTKHYKRTAGCIALKKKDFLILSKIININSKIKIN
tara:strand:+ start:15 stop:506 length:492 start_codon:yes stop_codon:yes gene_type:complete